MGDDKAPAVDTTFEALAATADRIAESAEHSAAVHDELGDHLPGAHEHAERDRRFAAAERAAAAAYRAHEVPSDEVRQVIRDVRPGGDPA
jgi:septal ring factor EnvC (AmiA/AmiB activator)